MSVQPIRLTKQNHRAKLHFPTMHRWSRPTTQCRWLPSPSNFAVDLMRGLLRDREHRLSSPVYRLHDLQPRPRPSSAFHMGGGLGDSQLRKHVYSNSANDIKTHPFFHGLQWNAMHTIRPPFVPIIHSEQEITKYFENADHTIPSNSAILPTTSPPTSPTASQEQQTVSDDRSVIPDQQEVTKAKMEIGLHELSDREFGMMKRAAGDLWHDWKVRRIEELQQQARRCDPPPNSVSSRCVPANVLGGKSKQTYKGKRRVKPRPQDPILRDATVGREALELRKKGAFVGYTFKRIQPLCLDALDDMTA